MPGKSLVIGFSSCAVLAVVAIAEGQFQAKVFEWKADPAAVKKLGAAASFEGYVLRVPDGYELLEAEKKLPASMKMSGWGGPKRADRSRPSVLLYIMTLPKDDPEHLRNLTLEQMSEMLTHTLRNETKKCKTDGPERSKINGIDFIRIRWSGIGIESNRETKGLIYLGRDGDRILQLTSKDFVPEGEKDLPLAEAAILSFKKK